MTKCHKNVLYELYHQLNKTFTSPAVIKEFNTVFLWNETQVVSGSLNGQKCKPICNPLKMLMAVNIYEVCNFA